MKIIPQPQSQIQEVLFELINRISIDRRQMMISCSVLNLPDQILNLRSRHGLTIELTKTKTENKFGREIEFGKYSLKNKKEAKKVYAKIQKEHTRRENERNSS